MSARILLVEDDESLRIALRDNLADAGYGVEVAMRIAEAEAALAKSRFDLIVLDVMLPDGDGHALARGLRTRGDRTFVLMLTALTSEEDIVRGFDAGADDYVEKPYRLAELLARVRALLRRGGTEEALTFAGFTLSLSRRVLANAKGESIELTKTELDFLAFLLANRDRALKRSEILAAVWSGVVVDARTIDNFVVALRRKLGWKPASPWRIRSLRGVGYRMEVDAQGA